MKIAILVFAFPPLHIGGAEIVAQNVAKNLAQKGHDIHIITSGGNGFMGQKIEDGFFVHRVYCPKIKYLGTMVFWLQGLFLIKKISPDLVYCSGVQVGVTGLLSKKLYKKPYVVWCQGSDIYLHWKGKKIISRITLNGANAVVVQTNHMARELEKECQRDIFVVPNGINLEHFKGFSRKASREIFNVRPDEKVILFMGRLHPVKGLEYLIEAFKIIHQKNPQTRLFLAGDGPQKQKLHGVVVKNGLEGKVDFLGKYANEKVAEYMAAADVFVLPSLSEGFGIVNVEAMASGLPIVATRVGGVAEIIKDGENGFLIEPKSPGQIAQKVLLLLGDSMLSQKISVNNKEKAQEYAWQSITEKLEGIFSWVLAHKDKNI